MCLHASGEASFIVIDCILFFGSSLSMRMLLMPEPARGSAIANALSLTELSRRMETSRLNFMMGL